MVGPYLANSPVEQLNLVDRTAWALAQKLGSPSMQGVQCHAVT